jgi:3'-5' exonuclease
MKMTPMERENIVFLDIETVPQQPDFSAIPEPLQHLWEEKMVRQKLIKETETLSDSYNRAGLYSEFGKIICIVVGYLKKESMVLHSFAGDDEVTLLKDFASFIEHHKPFGRQIQLCAHNGKEFDYPYIARRMIVNRLHIPALLDNSGKKPWEVPLLDTLELWKFGDYKAYTSLNLLAYILGLPSPKQDMDGSMVGTTYWHENGLDKIVRYCCNDVFTLANVFLRIKGEQTVRSENVIFEQL